jgi:hypothetical protein
VARRGAHLWGGGVGRQRVVSRAGPPHRHGLPLAARPDPATSLPAAPQAEAARHEAAVARELAAQREAEAKAAHERELAQIKRAEVRGDAVGHGVCRIHAWGLCITKGMSLRPSAC